MAKIRSYLANLRFDKKLKESAVASYLSNPRLVILIIFMIVLVGIASLLSLPRVLNPEVKIPIVLVSTILTGGAPKDIESLVSAPIEDAVTGVADVKKVTSSSRNSFSLVQIEFNSGVDPDKARSDVQSAVDSVNTLPPEVQLPKVQKLDFQNQPVWTFVVTGSKGAGSIEQFSKVLQTRLRDLAKVKEATISGLPDQEIQILLRPEAFSSYKINPLQITQIITAALGSFPAGSVRTDNSSFALSIDQDVTTVDDIRNLRLLVNGTSVVLSDIATISQRSKPDQVASLYATAKTPINSAVSFSVFKTAGSNITDAANDAATEAQKTVAEYNNEFKISTVLNTADEINKQFYDLIRDFSLTVILVFITLYVFVGIRQAIVTLLSAPVTFFITFIVMRIMGISLSFIAIFSLLLSLGLLVDDTVVVISAVSQYFRTGKFKPHEAGLLVWRDFIVVIFTTTITTVWAFLPLLLSSGIIGEFIKSIPIVVSTTLLASFFVAMFVILPVLIMILEGYIPNRMKIFLKISLGVVVFGALFVLLPKNFLFPLEIISAAVFFFVLWRVRFLLLAYIPKGKKVSTRESRYEVEHGLIHFDKISHKYKIIMHKILVSSVFRKRTIVMVVIFSIFSYLLLPLGLIRNEFFPKSDNNYIYVSLELPQGTNTEVTVGEAKNVLNQLKNTPGVSFVTADIGRGFSEQAFGAGSAGNNSVLFSLALLPKEKRKDSPTIAADLRHNFAAYQKGNIQVVEISGGPPAGADVQIKLFGENLSVLDANANKVMEYLKKQPGAENIDKSIKPGTSKLVFVPDKDKLLQVGVSPDTLGFWLRLFASGFKANGIKLENEVSTDKEDITIRMSSSTEFAESINSIQIPTQNGNIPLVSLGRITVVPNPTLITREDGKRTISVTASVGKGYSVSTINGNLVKYANSGLALPTGYTWTTGGINEENQNSVNSILQAMLLSFLLIVVTMVIQFSSFRRALIVMLVIPLSISGVFIIFALTQTPLSFPALIGVLALFGIVVKNSILVVDKIVQNQKAGMGYVDSIVDATGTRLEPIALTTFATIAGLVPITLSNPLWRGLGGAIIAGLIFSGTIMLFFIPVVYFYLFRPKDIK